MSESSYKELKTRSVSLLTFENKKTSWTVLIAVNLVFLSTILTQLPFLFLFALVSMTIVMISLLVGLFQQAIGSDVAQYIDLYLY